MGLPGGSSTVEGVEYQLWFTAKKLGEAFWSETFELIIPEAHLEPDSESGGVRLVSVDDLIVRTREGDTYYNIKFKDSDGSWTIGQLRARGVWEQFWEQYQRTPGSRLEFVTQSGIDNTLYECLNRIRNARDVREVDSLLDSKKYIAVFKTLCEYFIPATAEQVLHFLQCVYLVVRQEEEVRNSLVESFRGRVTNSEFIAAELHLAAGDWAKTNRKVSREDIQRRLRQAGFLQTSDLTSDELAKQFYKVSAEIEACSNELPLGTNSFHIKRDEVQVLLNWVRQPLPPSQKREAPMHLLVGKAGTGKSAIMKDLLLELRAEGIPVIGLKADRLQKKSLAKLHKSIQAHGLRESLDKAIATLSNGKQTPVVVLIDQLDALSQSLSANRGPLNSYNALIKELAELPVKIIVSCRQFDLQTDPVLVGYRSKDTLMVGLLPDADVNRAVEALGLDSSSLTAELRTLLQIPLHLEVFCKVCPTSDVIGELLTIQDLYRELYDRIVARARLNYPTANITCERLEAFLNVISDRMYQLQRLSLPTKFGVDEYRDEREYLLSQGLLVLTPQGLSCFHQSFFDYLYARNFVQKGITLSESLASAHQGLFIRSRTQQVLTYLRETDFDEYVVEVRCLLSTRFRYHVQLLAIQHLASVAEPYAPEIDLVEQLIIPVPEWSAPFLELVQHAPWFQFLYRKGYLRQLALEAPYSEWAAPARAAFWSLATYCPALFITVTAGLPEFEGKAAFLARHSFRAKCFDNPGYQQLFEKYSATIRKQDAFTFAYVLDEAAAVAPAWALEQLWNAVLTKPKSKSGVTDDERDSRRDTFTKAYAAAPEIAFDYGKRLMEYWVEKQQYRYIEDATALIGDSAFSPRAPTHMRENDMKPQVYAMVRNHLQRWSKVDSAAVLKNIQPWLSSPALTLRQLAIEVLAANPHAYQSEVVDVLSCPTVMHHRSMPKYLTYIVRSLLHRCYPRFTDEQRQRVDEAINATLRNPYHYKVPLEGQKRPYKYVETDYGRTALCYLESIPTACRHHRTHLQILHEKLSARHGKLYNKKPKASSLSYGGGPSPLSNVPKEALSKVNWLDAFRHYIPKDTKSGSAKRLQEALSEHFQHCVQNEASLFLPFLKELLNDKSLPKLYLTDSLNGLVKSSLAPELVRDILLEACGQGWMEDDAQVILMHYAVEKKVVDYRTANLFASVALRNPEHVVAKTSSREFIEEAINCTGGRAVRETVVCLQEEATQELAFQVLEQLAKVGDVYVRGAIAYYLALGMYINRSRTVKLFSSLVKDDEPVLRAGQDILVRLSNSELSDYLPKLVVSITDDNINFYIGMLTHAWYWDNDEVLSLLKENWTANPATRIISFDYLFDNYGSMRDSGKEKAKMIFDLFLQSEDKELHKAYEQAFSHFKPADFLSLIEHIRRYVGAPVGKGRLSEFYKFLLENVQVYPEECFELARSFTTHDLPDIQRDGLGNKPVDFILQVYNILSQRRASGYLLDAVIDVLDCMLQTPQYRASAQERLQVLDR